MSDVILGSLPTPNDIKGTLATEEKMSGNLSTVYGIDGKSAYEVAVKNGFEGTEAEWLASLKGADGTMTFEELTPEQKESLRGEKGDAFEYSDFTPEQLVNLKGEKGDAFTYEDFTPEQLASLKGDTGNPGIYLGSGDMPADCNVQIDPDGDCFTLDEELNAMKMALLDKIGKVGTQVEQIKSDVGGLQAQINEEAHFRGYLSTNEKIQALEATPNDFAYSAESGTKWIYDTDDGWQDTNTPVPDQLTPASEATPLMDGAATVGTAENYARGDHRHPTDTTRVGVDEFNEFKSELEIGLDNIISIQNSLIGGGSQ